MANPTPTTVKNKARSTAFKCMYEIYCQAYGDNKVFCIGDSEIAVEIDTAPTGEPIYAIFSPIVKDYCDRTTKTKTIKAFNLTAEINAYTATLEKRAKEEAEAKAKKAEKIARDKAQREANVKAKAEAKEKRGKA